MKEKKSVFYSICIIAAFSSLSGSALAGSTELISVSSEQIQGNDHSFLPTISADGRFVAFISDASNLVAGDTNGFDDVFVRDRVSGITERVSVSSDEIQGNQNTSYYRALSISADGRFVAFHSEASNLVAGDTNNSPDIFVRDRVNGTTERVSVSSDEIQGNSPSGTASISADGRFVAFYSTATSLVAGDTNNKFDTFVRDMVNGTTERVSVSSDEIQGNDHSGSEVVISADGRFVAFRSRASNLVAGDTNGTYDVFIRDMVNGTTERVSVSSDQIQGNNESGGGLSISADGRFVAFYSTASNLVAGDTNGTYDVFVRDRVNGTTELVSVSSDEVQGNSGSWQPSISADGRFVFFSSHAWNLVAGDTNGRYDIFVRDRVNGTTERVSVSSDEIQGNDDSYRPSVSADGRFVAFQSVASNLVAGDTNGTQDVFVHDRKNIPDIAEAPPTGLAGEESPTFQSPPGPAQSDSDILVVLVHGWNSSPEAWANNMAERIKSEASDVGINVVKYIYDWGSYVDLGNGVLFDKAYGLARIFGTELGQAISCIGYSKVHFIAHSVGSRLIQSAFEEMEKEADRTGCRVPSVHMTFFDAFDPYFSGFSEFGKGARWAEHFVDKRTPLIANGILPFAYNFDITDLDADASPFHPVLGHQWPYKWYNCTIDLDNPDNDECEHSIYGFPVAIESGQSQFLPDHYVAGLPYLHFPRGDECVLKRGEEANCGTTGETDLPPFTIFDVIEDIPNVIEYASDRAVIQISNLFDSIIELTTGSPAWVNFLVESDVAFNALQFDYEFLSWADGLLSVSVDGDLVFNVLERHTYGGTNKTGLVPVGNVGPGEHVLSFRLDPLEGGQSMATITNLQLGNATVAKQEPTPAFMIESLSDLVRSYNLPHGTEQALLAKLEAALIAIEGDDPLEALDPLQAFMNFVEAQTDKKIPFDLAERLLDFSWSVEQAM